VALAINLIIGGGIFGMPAKVFSLSGPASVVAYLICAGAVIPIVFCFAEVGSRFTQTGGPYLYAFEALGPLVGFEAGWLRWLSGIASCAALANLLADYLSYLWPAAYGGPWRALTIIGVIGVLTTVNVLGVRDVAATSNALAIAKLLPLLLFIIAGLFFIQPPSRPPRASSS
jgi:amino acid transporter